jgi:hypothetical protein
MIYMLYCKLYTKDYKHDYQFEFRGQKYRVHSIVKLTEDGQFYLGAWKREVILTEQFTFRNGKLYWTYEFKSIALNEGVLRKSTDIPPDKLIEEIVKPATDEYFLREKLGAQASNYTTGTKQMTSDWNISELRSGWITYILVFFGVFIFKDWYIRAIIWIGSSWLFGIYRNAYINAYTVYMPEDDKKMLKIKYETLYSAKENKENK